MRRAVAVFALLGSFAARPAQGQGSVSFSLPQYAQDSVLALGPGATDSVSLVFNTYVTSQYCYGLSYYSLTLGYDSAQVSVPAATALPYSGFPALTFTPHPGSTDLAATGANPNCLVSVATVTFKLDPAATLGSYITIVPQTLTSYYYTFSLLPTTAAIPLRICHATRLWGDLDRDGQVSSRDALIALTDAVGLPIPGFDETVADIDGDNVVTSRDALFILSRGIGQDLSRAGHWKADACPPPPQSPPFAESVRSGGRTFKPPHIMELPR